MSLILLASFFPLPLSLTQVGLNLRPPLQVESREQAQTQLGQDRPTRWMAAAVIIGIWLLIAAIDAALVLHIIRG